MSGYKCKLLGETVERPARELFVPMVWKIPRFESSLNSEDGRERGRRRGWPGLGEGKRPLSEDPQAEKKETKREVEG